MDEPLPLPLRERTRRRVADEIEAAAFALFREHGYEATTVDHIATAAGVSTRTFFRYFPTKEAVVFAHHDADLAEFRAALAAQPVGASPVDLAFAAMSAATERWYQAHGPERLRLLGTEPMLRAHEAARGEDLEDAVATELVDRFGGGPEVRLRAAVIAGAVFGGLRGARRSWSNAPVGSPHQVFSATRDVLSGMTGNVAPADREEASTGGDGELDRPP